MQRPPRKKGSIVPTLAGLAIVLALAGQYALGLSRTPAPTALLYFALAVACLLLAERLAGG